MTLFFGLIVVAAIVILVQLWIKSATQKDIEALEAYQNQQAQRQKGGVHGGSNRPQPQVPPRPQPQVPPQKVQGASSPSTTVVDSIAQWAAVDTTDSCHSGGSWGGGDCGGDGGGGDGGGGCD